MANHPPHLMVSFFYRYSLQKPHAIQPHATQLGTPL